MKWFLGAFMLFTPLLAAQAVRKPPVVVIRDPPQEIWICAEYRTPGVKIASRSCQTAETVRAWLLQNGRPD